MIKLNNVNKYYFKGKENEIHVINNTSLDFPNKGLVVLLGSSGSGKTTLLNVLSGLDSIDSGIITFDDNIMKSKYSTKWDYIRNSSIGYLNRTRDLPEPDKYSHTIHVVRNRCLCHMEISNSFDAS